MRILSFVLALTGVMAANSSPAQPITIGHMPITNVSEIVAAHLGLYEKYGIQAELKIFQSGPAAIQGLLSGDLQVAQGGVVPMINLAVQNVPLYYLVSAGINTPESPSGTIMVRSDDGSIKSLADLKGKKIGQLGKGTITHLWLWNAASKYGMKREDLQEVFVPFPQMGGLLASKQVDAVYAWPPFDTIIEQAKQGILLTDDSGWNPYAVISAMIVRKDWADKNVETVIKLVKISIEAGRWVDDHPEEARKIIGTKLGLPEPIYSKMRMSYFPRNGYQPMPSIWEFYHLMVKAGQIQPFPNAQETIQRYWIDPGQRFIAPALAQLGSQQDPTIERLLKIKLPNLPDAPETYFAPWEKSRP